MNKTISPALHKSLAVVAAMLLAGCADEGPVTPDRLAVLPVQFAALSATDRDGAIATLRRATARYHKLNVAIDEGFVFLHGCENRPEGTVGTVYVHLGRLMDGRIDPAKPEALIYQPARGGDKPKLLGVELAIPYALWPGQEPPKFLGVPFQTEDEFGVFGLHIWIWSANPNGLFAEANPKVSCGEA